MKTKSSILPSMRLALLGVAAIAVLPLAAQVPVPPPPPEAAADRAAPATPPPPPPAPGVAISSPPPPAPPVPEADGPKPPPPHPSPAHGPEAGPPPDPKHGHAPKKHSHTPEQPLQHLNGIVREYLINPDGEADGLLLKDGTQLRFPPHMSTDLVRIIKPKAAITAEGRRETPQSFRAFTITDAASHVTVIESRPSAPHVDPAARTNSRQMLEAAGRISLLLTSPHGGTDGAVLENGSILRFRPEVAHRFVKLLASGLRITARGMGTENLLGRCIEISEIGEPGGPPLPPGAGEHATAAEPPPPPRP